MDNTENVLNELAKVFIKEITFNDKTSIELNHNSIIVFTGANNSGKSQVLKDIDGLSEHKAYNARVITNIGCEFYGDITETFIDTHFYKNVNGNLIMYVDNSAIYEENSIKEHWKVKSLQNKFHKIFIKFIDTQKRLTTSNPLQRKGSPESHPIYKLFKNQTISQTISTYFKQAFGVDILVNRNEITDMPLYVGNAPDSNAYTIARHDEYYDEVGKLERLENQGDGMRSFASILLDTFTSEYSVTLIDEPEAFLHPPQARLLGKMLAKNNPNNRQLFVSTHSEDFLQGLLDADNTNVTIIRINRKDKINHMSILKNSEIKKLWSNPILRYSNILSGLFHEKVIVCESDYDCLFYNAVMNAIYEEKNEIAPDVLFTHCGGKGRMKDVVRALHALKVHVVAIPDFDIINNSGEFKPLVEAFGINWSDLPMKDIYDWLNANQTYKETIKRQGKHALDNGASLAYKEVELISRYAGLFVVPCGEMECFRKNNLNKADWVFNELENSDLAIDLELHDVREFIQSVLEFQLS